ncbi:membrane protein insertion efficiency factor YidD [Microbacterium sp. LRZ72]|nr:membrane protein insertion efficiency factor YidD [Microbacterium sp. LRZ72]
MTGAGHFSAARGARFLVQSLALVPRNVALGILWVYRATISPIYGDVCKYYPSCSSYAVGAVQQYGAVVGSVRAARRLSRCHPWAQGGIDDVPPHRDFMYELTPRGFVVPAPPRKD